MGTGARTVQYRAMSDRALVALFALLKLALHLATSSGYGYFRDELYYLACADHLAAGYVDHPPLSVFVLWAVRGLIGEHFYNAVFLTHE